MPPLTSRTFSAALAALLIAAPAAAASTRDLRSPDARDASAAPTQDLRSPDARDAEAHPRSFSYKPPADPAINVQPQELAPVEEQSAPSSGSATRPPLPGPPTWPAHPQPISAAPATNVTAGGNGIDWTTIMPGIAGSLLAVSGIAALANRRRQRALRATH
jgi:hypothetical protein